MRYVPLEPSHANEDGAKLRAIFRDLEKKARMSGNAKMLLELDRTPGLLLGPANRVPEGAEAAAIGAAFEALKRITDSL